MAMVIVEMEAGVFVRVSEEEAERLGKTSVTKTASAPESKNKAVKPQSKKAAPQAEPVAQAVENAGDEVNE
jgi:hypothetical protein